MCGKTHDLDDCKEYLKKTLQERREFLKDKDLCFACYQAGHRSSGCAQRKTCKTCSRRPTGLHDDNFRLNQLATKKQNPSSEQSTDVLTATHVETEEAVCSAVGTGNPITALPIVPVRLKAAGKEVLTYAMLDSCSTGTFLLEDIAASLDAKGTDTKLMVKTVNGTQLHDTKALNGLIVTDLNDENRIDLPKTFTKEDISAIDVDVPVPELAHKWKHLERIADCMPSQLHGAKVGLLIGSSCPKALEPIDIVASENGGPYAINTFAGWAIVGPLYLIKKDHQTVNCNRIAVVEVGSEKPLDHHFAVEDKVKEIVTPQALIRMFELDFPERSDERAHQYSQEDKKFLEIVNKGIKRTDDGHYEIPLPFRSKDVHLPDNKEQVFQRACWLKRKLTRNKKFHEDYVDFMNDTIQKGFARKVPPDRLPARSGQVWYIPHHGVYHPKKPNKIRVVFDCSARYGGTSLNDQLMQGPDLTSRLVGVLTRFRHQPVAFMGDIDAMFHQVRVPHNQRDFLRFFWWSDGLLDEAPAEYQMNVHLFGAVSSPSCSNFALRQAADDAEKHVGSETADVLRNNFYVDDCLRSEDSEETAIERLRGVRSACSLGGFNLSKIVSSRRNVLMSVPHDIRAHDLRTLDLSCHFLPVERALGVQWAIESDTLGFRIILKDKPLTRRGILSTICSVYDPLGIAAPFLLNGKKILQDLCRMKIDWDEEIDLEFRVRWKKWRNQLSALEDFAMDRCVIPDGFGSVVSRQIHHFSDASATGYGQVTYLRSVDDKGNIHCAFLMGKSRLAPLKAMTIPRLELTAATTSVQVGGMISRELGDPVDGEIYWTDSTTVLKYIRNETKRFHVSVANRVQRIRDETDPIQWKHVDSENNPADDASRGLEGNQITKRHRWVRGPDFLWHPESEWPTFPCDLDAVFADDPEVKKVVTHATVSDEKEEILTRFARFSNWNRMKRCVARILRLKQFLAHVQTPLETRRAGKLSSQPLKVEELQRAEQIILKLVQGCAFPKESEALRKIQGEERQKNRDLVRVKKVEIKKTSTLYRLDPFLDQNGLLRVGGRFSRSQVFPDNFKYPIILPKKSFVVDLIIRDAHEKVAHSGRGITLGTLRS